MYNTHTTNNYNNTNGGYGGGGGYPSNQQDAAGGPSRAELVLEHALGYTARPNNLCFAGTGAVSFGPNSGRRATVDAPLMAFGCGKVVVVSNLDDSHSQRLLRGFGAPVTCLDACHVPPSALGLGGAGGGGNGPSSRVGEPLINAIVTGHAASPDGVCYVNFWDADNGGLIKTVPTPHKFMVTAVSNNNSGSGPIGGGFIAAVKFSPDGLLFATTGSDGSVCVMECAGASRLGWFKDAIANDEANAVLWSSVRGSGTRDQQYIFIVPFSTGVRAFTLQFNVRTLSYDMRCDPFNAPGGGGRTGGFQRRYAAIDQLGDDVLCGCSNGEVVVFSASTGNFRAAFTVAHGAITGVAAAPNGRCVFVCASDGSVKRLVGRDAEWQVSGEVFLTGSRYAAKNVGGAVDALHQTRCVAMAINNGFSATATNHHHNGNNLSADQLIISSSSGVVYRMLCEDMSYTIASEGPTRAVTALAVKDGGNATVARRASLLPANTSGNNGNGSAPPLAASSIVASCSADGAVRLWSLDDYQTIATYYGHAPRAEASAANAAAGAAFPNTGRHNSNNNARSQGAVGGGGGGFGGSIGGRALGGRFGQNDNVGGFGSSNANVGSSAGYNSGAANAGNAFSGSVTTATLSGNNGAAGFAGSAADAAIVPLCAVFDTRAGADEDPSSFVLITGWSDGRVRAIDFTECVAHFFATNNAGPTSSSSFFPSSAPQPSLSYELISAHKGPVSAIDTCGDYLATGGGADFVVRLWSNPPPPTPAQLRALHTAAAAPNNGYQPPFDPASHHQRRAVVAEINAHRGPITGLRIDNATTGLLHTASADMSHKVFDLQSLAGGLVGAIGDGNGGHRPMPRGGMNHNNANSNAIGLTASHGGNPQAPRCVRSHEVSHASGFLSLAQRCDREHEAVVGTGDGQLLFFDIDVPSRPTAAVVDANRVPIVAADVWNGARNAASSSSSSSQALAHERLAVGLADGSVLVYALSEGLPQNVNNNNSTTTNGGGGFGYGGRGGNNNNNASNDNNGNAPSPAAQHGVRLVFSSQGHSGAVTSVRWSPDGRQLFTAGAQGELYVWDYFAM